MQRAGVQGPARAAPRAFGWPAQRPASVCSGRQPPPDSESHPASPPAPLAVAGSPGSCCQAGVLGGGGGRQPRWAAASRLGFGCRCCPAAGRRPGSRACRRAGVPGEGDAPADFLALAAESEAWAEEAEPGQQAQGGLNPGNSMVVSDGLHAAQFKTDDASLIEQSHMAALYTASPRTPPPPLGSPLPGMSILISKPEVHRCAAFDSSRDEADRQRWAQHVPSLLQPRTMHLMEEIKAIGGLREGAECAGSAERTSVAPKGPLLLGRLAVAPARSAEHREKNHSSRKT